MYKNLNKNIIPLIVIIVADSEHAGAVSDSAVDPYRLCSDPDPDLASRASRSSRVSRSSRTRSGSKSGS
jgi:hypothetical protein